MRPRQLTIFLKARLISMKFTFCAANSHSLVRRKGYDYACVCKINMAARCRTLIGRRAPILEIEEWMPVTLMGMTLNTVRKAALPLRNIAEKESTYLGNQLSKKK